MHRSLSVAVALFALFSVALPAAAFEVPANVKAATVTVVCGDRLGSGVVVNAEKGYVLTNGHVPIDYDTHERVNDCKVAFPGPEFHLRTEYEGKVVHAVLDDEHDTDFAIIRLTSHVAGPPLSSLPAAVKADVAIDVGTAIAAVGYPQGVTTVASTEGEVLGFERGIILSDAVLEEGNSGGPAVDAAGDLVGVSTRIRYRTDGNGGTEVIDYGFGDVAALMTWLDTVDPLGHDEYLSHAADDVYHDMPYYVRDAQPGCDAVVRTYDASTVYCLRTGGHRAAFPDVATYQSWYGDDFSEVQYISADNLAEYRLTGLVTRKAGSLIKIQSDPSVYVVTDDIGTLRRIPDEATAQRLFGTGWASLVRDVSEAFFPVYTVGRDVDPVS